MCCTSGLAPWAYCLNKGTANGWPFPSNVSGVSSWACSHASSKLTKRSSSTRSVRFPSRIAVNSSRALTKVTARVSKLTAASIISLVHWYEHEEGSCSVVGPLGTLFKGADRNPSYEKVCDQVSPCEGYPLQGRLVVDWHVLAAAVCLRLGHEARDQPRLDQPVACLHCLVPLLDDTVLRMPLQHACLRIELQHFRLSARPKYSEGLHMQMACGFHCVLSLSSPRDIRLSTVFVPAAPERSVALYDKDEHDK